MERGDQDSQHTAQIAASSGVSAIDRQLRYARVRRNLFSDAPVSVSLGHYKIVRKLGEGGGGVVYLAHDTSLDRQVALKLLHVRPQSPPSWYSSLAREATVMAQIRHPHVASVYELVSDGPMIGVAMEYVEGQSLRDWIRAADPTISEMIDAFVDACRGLAAVHDGGMVHRDFKPANVMRDSTGRVQVVDFGLAGEVRPEESVGDVCPGTPGASAETTLYSTVVGTPRYMAPEQLAGRRVAPTADVYALCLSMAEALGSRLPPGEALHTAKHSGTIPLPCHAPRRIRAVLARGLKVEPVQRYRHAGQLLRALLDARRPRRGRAIAVGSLGLLGLSAAATGAILHEPACPPDAPSWTPARAADLERALDVHAGPLRHEAWTALQHNLDAYAESIALYRTQACTLPQERRAQPLQCVAALHEHAEALLDLPVVAADQDPLFAAGALAAHLPSATEYCARWPASGAVDPRLAAEIELIRGMTSRGDLDPARRAVAEAMRKAEATGNHAALAELLAERAILRLAEPNGAEKATHDMSAALEAAERSGDDTVALFVLGRSVSVFGVHLDSDEGERYVAQGEGRLARARVSAPARARFRIQVAQYRHRRGDADEAIELLQEVLDGDARAPSDARLIGILVLSTALIDAGQHETADALLVEATALDKQLSGGVDRASYIENLRGHIALDDDRVDDAIEHYRNSARFSALVSEHDAMVPLWNLGKVLQFRDPDAALRALARAHELAVEHAGERSAGAQGVAVEISQIEMHTDPAKARDRLERLCPSMASGPRRAMCRSVLLVALVNLGDLRAARPIYEETRAVLADGELGELSRAAAFERTAMYAEAVGDRSTVRRDLGEAVRLYASLGRGLQRRRVSARLADATRLGEERSASGATRRRRRG